LWKIGDGYLVRKSGMVRSSKTVRSSAPYEEG
jgi:hypothetical protein